MVSPIPSSSPLGPFALMPWADFGLRTLDAMLSTGQVMGEQVDRLARAQSAAEPDGSGGAAAAGTASELPAQALGMAGPAFAAMAQWQGAALQWMNQAWQQWFSLMGAFNPLATRGEGGPGSALQAAPLAPLPGLAAAPEAGAAARSAVRSAVKLAQRNAAELEHAFAGTGTRQRRSRGAAAQPAKPRAATRKSNRAG
jgi:hypothetical protein